jgi:catechol 2,3-dioxygenase-like lactoylglutathione lyase family enzyme
MELDHTIVWCGDKQRSAEFLARMFGRPAPRPVHHFLVVDADNGVSLDFMQKEGRVARQHYAFRVSDEEFDGVLARIRAGGLPHWADPARTRPGEIDHRNGGRGVYFEDPDGHLLEALTRPQGD